MQSQREIRAIILEKERTVVEGAKNYYFIILERGKHACSYRETKANIFERERTLIERGKNYYL